MAGDWIPIRKGLQDELEVRRLAILMHCDVWSIVGYLVAFWSWCDSVTEDGFIKDVKLDEMLTFCSHLNDKCAHFFRHLCAVGWLEECEGGVKIPNFNYWLGNSAKRRFRQARYKRDKRQAGQKIDKRGNSKADRMAANCQLEERRGEKSINTPLPPNIDTPEMRAAWEDWVQHRREIGKKLTPASIKQQHAKLATMGVERGIAAVHHSIANGWQGLFEPKKGDLAQGKPCESTAERHARIQREKQERRRRTEEGAVSLDQLKSKLNRVLPGAAKTGEAAREPSKGEKTHPGANGAI